MSASLNIGVQQIVRTLLQDVAEDPTRLTKALDSAVKQIDAEFIAAGEGRDPLDDVTVEFDPDNNFCFKRGTKWVELSDALKLLAAPREYEYRSENVPGNMHVLCEALKEGNWLHGWEPLVAQNYGGNYTVAILRRPK